MVLHIHSNAAVHDISDTVYDINMTFVIDLPEANARDAKQYLCTWK